MALAEIFFDDVRVPKDFILPPPPKGRTGMGIVQGMPIEKYVRDAIIQKHISFPFPTRFKITETLAGYKRKVAPFIGAN